MGACVRKMSRFVENEADFESTRGMSGNGEYKVTLSVSSVQLRGEQRGLG